MVWSGLNFVNAHFLAELRYQLRHEIRSLVTKYLCQNSNSRKCLNQCITDLLGLYTRKWNSFKIPRGIVTYRQDICIALNRTIEFTNDIYSYPSKRLIKNWHLTKLSGLTLSATSSFLAFWATSAIISHILENSGQ